MNNRIIKVKHETVKRGRTDSLKDFFFSCKLYWVLPISITIEILFDIMFGSKWLHDKGEEVLLVKISVNNKVMEFLTTEYRYAVLLKCGFFYSGIFTERVAEIKKDKALDREIQKLTSAMG